MLIENNVLSLNIVKSEIDITLSQTAVSLEAFDENRSDSSKLLSSIDGFKQLRGTFDMLCMPGASLLCEEMALAADAIGSQSDTDKDDTLAKISNAIVVLERYLEYVQLTQGGLPELLLVSINELKSITGKRPVSESYFFSIDLSPFKVDDVHAIENETDSQGASRRLRHMYQVGLLGSFKEENLKTNFKMMARALERLNKLYEDSHSTQLLWICNGVVAALISGNITLTKPRKIILGRIDRQVKQLLNSSGDLLDQDSILALVKDCLYIVALAEPTTDLIKEIQTHFELTKYNLNEQHIVQERELMTGPSASVIRTVAAALKEDIGTIKDKLDVLSRSEEETSGAELVDLSDDFNRIAHTLIMLGLPSASKRLKSLVSGLTSDGNEESKIRDLADALVFIEHAITRLEKNNTPVSAEQQDVTEDKDALDLDAVFTTVIVETRQAISDVQRAIGDYIELQFDRSKVQGIPEVLHSAWGGVLFLNIDRVPEMLRLSSRFVHDKIILDEAGNPNVETLETFADALASIDYYLESFEEKKPIGEGILDIAEESLDELGYSMKAA